MMLGADISITRLFFQALLPATLGNLVGGGLMIGAVYWYVFDSMDTIIHFREKKSIWPEKGCYWQLVSCIHTDNVLARYRLRQKSTSSATYLHANCLATKGDLVERLHEYNKNAFDNLFYQITSYTAGELAK
jgi:hypothetical protein